MISIMSGLFSNIQKKNLCSSFYLHSLSEFVTTLYCVGKSNIEFSRIEITSLDLFALAKVRTIEVIYMALTSCHQGLFGVMILMEVLFVVMMHVMVLPTVGGTNKVAEMQLNFWREKLPSVQVPETVAASMSPLTQDEVSAFVKIIKGGNLHFHATQFCKSANLLCSQSIPLKKVPIITQCPYSYVESDKISDMFFSKKELREGGQITLPELYRPWKAFLPRNLSQLIPFATVALSEVIASFGFWERSNMTKNMNNTLITCEDKPLQGELKMCTMSIEGMIEFVVSTLGSSDNVQLFSHPAVTGDFGKKARVSKVVERLSGPSNRPPLVCHRSVYPYGVFYCHSFNGTVTFTMELEVSEKNGNIYNATAVCHPDVQSKRLDYCHLILGDTLLWLAKDKR